ncbi:hypothetical protein B7486_65660 [cyanobacterium TDX16]|nr:hypothetical protein B7486_65660 [cyanobacterium TDX16]
MPGWVSPAAAADDGGWERWAEEGDDVVAPYDADGVAPDEWQPPASPAGGAGGGRRMSPLLGAGIVAIVLLVVAAGLFAFDRLRGDDGGSSEDAAETTSTTAPPTTSTTVATPTTVVGTGPLVEVPNVVGMGLFEASGLLTEAGFISAPERRIDPAGQQGIVVEQDPPSGMVPQGSSVRIVFTEPEEPAAAADGSTDTTAAPFG